MVPTDGKLETSNYNKDPLHVSHQGYIINARLFLLSNINIQHDVSLKCCRLFWLHVQVTCWETRSHQRKMSRKLNSHGPPWRPNDPPAVYWCCNYTHQSINHVMAHMPKTTYQHKFNYTKLED